MANPTPPTSPLTWTKISCTDGSGPDLYYASATSSVGTSAIYQVSGGRALVVAAGATPDVTAMTWTTLAASTSGAPGAVLSYAPIASSAHGLYLLPGGDLSYE